MNISQTGLDLIKKFEGLRLEAYRDVAGIWTIGYGHTGDLAHEDSVITEAKAEWLLRQDVSWSERAVDDIVKVSLSQNEFDALVSLVFNIGVGNFQSSTCLRRLNNKDRNGAAMALQWFNKARIGGELQEVAGLVRRRAAEAELFLTPYREPETQHGTSKLKAAEETKASKPRMRKCWMR